MKKASISFGEFTQLSTKFITEEDGIDCKDVNAVAFSNDGTLYISTSAGLFSYDGLKINKTITGEFNSFNGLYRNDSELYAFAENTLLVKKNKSFTQAASFDSKIIAMSTGVCGSVWLITENDLYLKNENDYTFEAICGMPQDANCLAVLKKGSLYSEVVYCGTTNAGLMAMKGKRRHWAELLPDVTGALSMNITSVAFDAMGYLWVGSDKGVNVYDGKNQWASGKSIYSIPDTAVNDMFFSKDGKKYFATKTGIITLIEGKLSYYSYGAWLKHPDAKKITVADNGTIVAVTERGISVISADDITLEKKAAHMDELAEKYFVRKDGYCIDRILYKPGVIENGWLSNSDNDGLFTGMYCAGQCYHYAVTKSKTALKNAKRAVHAMIKLTEITGVKGFTARAIRYSDEPNFGTGVRSEWHISESDPECEWLGETSSDEMTGHYYAYATYYDLCADAEEKKKIESVIKNITDHIIEHNFHLTDADGIPTTWANWQPELLNNDDKWFYERGTNSLEILSFLKTAFHITGDKKYNDVYDSLISDYHYGINTMQYKIEDAHIAHIDDQLDCINIINLIKYCENEGQKELFKMGLTHHWAYERCERSPLANVVYGSLTHNACDIEKAAISLSELPMDMIRWQTYNSYRKDIIWDDEQEKIGMPPQLKEPVEYYSKYVGLYDGNPFVCDVECDEFTNKNNDTKSNRAAFLPSANGADGTKMQPPTIYLLPYWMARYYNLITD